MKATLTELMQRIPGQVTEEWPMGEPFAEAFRHGSMSVEVYAPKDTDIQKTQTGSRRNGLKHVLIGMPPMACY